MDSRLVFKIISYFILTASLSKVQAQNQSVRQFVKWDSENNPGFGGQSQETFIVEHLEIPLAHPNNPYYTSLSQWEHRSSATQDGIIVDLAPYLSDSIRNSLLFYKDGNPYVRFILSPNDTKYGPQLENYLNSRNIPYAKNTYFTGLRTASRSIIVTDPNSGESFSIKPSTNQATKLHTDDPAPVRWAHLNRKLSDYYWRMKDNLRYLDIAWEAGMVATPPFGEGGDISYQVRLIDGMSSGQERHMSGFVYQDKNEARKVAETAQMDYHEFWKQAIYIKSRAMVELSAVLGFMTTSNHDQNFRWALDQNGRLTGKLIVLDLADGQPLEGVFRANGETQLLGEWNRLVSDTNPTIRDHLVIANFMASAQIEPQHIDSYFQGIRDGLSELTEFGPRKIEAIISGWKSFYSFD